MFKRLAFIGAGVAALALAAAPAPARQHKSEPPEPARHGRGADDGVRHASRQQPPPADDHNRNRGGNGADHRNDGPNHK